MDAMQTMMGRDVWIDSFAQALRHLRPCVEHDVSMAIGSREWAVAGGISPVDAARRYHGRHPQRRLGS